MDIVFLEKYSGAYDLTKAYSLVRVNDYSHIMNAQIMILENKFDLSIDSIKLISDNYLNQFYDFLSLDFDTSKTGRIGNGTIDKVFYFYLIF